MTRFWGVVVAVKPRLVLTKFDGDTTAKCHGHLILLDGTRQTEGEAHPVAGRFLVAVGPATQEQRQVRPGDLLRGDAHPVPETVPDTPADLYRVGVLRVVARAGDPGASAVSPADPPRTDPPLAPHDAEAAPRRALNPILLGNDNACQVCPYGTMVPVVRLSDPRDFRTGRWSLVPACLGPEGCPHYQPYAG